MSVWSLTFFFLNLVVHSYLLRWSDLYHSLLERLFVGTTASRFTGWVIGWVVNRVRLTKFSILILLF